MTQQQADQVKIPYVNVDPYVLDAQLAVDQAVSQHNGQPFDAIGITTNSLSATKLMHDALVAELAKTCPKCSYSDVNVETPKWTTDVAGTVSSQLLQHPNTTVLLPYYAGKIQTAGPGKGIVQSDIGGYPPWTGYLMFLDPARAWRSCPRSAWTRPSARTGSSRRTTRLRSCRPAAGAPTG